jgi:hypothetical protein
VKLKELLQTMLIDILHSMDIPFFSAKRILHLITLLEPGRLAEEDTVLRVIYQLVIDRVLDDVARYSAYQNKPQSQLQALYWSYSEITSR